MATLAEARDAGQELLDRLMRGEFEEYLEEEEHYHELCAEALAANPAGADAPVLRALLDTQAAIEKQLGTMARGVAAEMVRVRRRESASRAYLATTSAGLPQG